jgi:hypothetical protein
MLETRLCYLALCFVSAVQIYVMENFEAERAKMPFWIFS